jgi:glycosyltransferase involved in cell wall biosynthesis
MPLVSIILPVFNGAATLGDTVRSLLAQTEPDWELLIIDDGSTDRSLALAESFAAADRRIWAYPFANAGQAIARNRGIERAQGNYVSFIDADDRWHPDKLRAQLAALAADPAAAWAYSWTLLTDDDGRAIGQPVASPFRGWIYGPLLVTDFVSSGSNVLVRRSALAAVGGFDPACVPSEDWELWLRLAWRFPVAQVPAAHVFYRQRPTSSSENVWRQERVSRQIIQQAIARSPDRLAPYRAAIWGNRYKYLLFKALDGPARSRRGWTAIRFAAVVLWCDRGVLKQWRLCLGVAVKILGMVLPGAIGRGLGDRPSLHRIHDRILALTRVPRFDRPIRNADS